jgi:CBS domain-containing protein
MRSLHNIYKRDIDTDSTSQSFTASAYNVIAIAIRRCGSENQVGQVSEAKPMSLVHELLRRKANNNIWSIGPEASVFAAITSMAEHEVGALLVIGDGDLVGIISERDYARKVIIKEKSSKLIPVSEIMTHEVITVDSKYHIDECVTLMKERHIRHLPVVDDQEISGMLSLRDLFAATIKEQAETIDHLEHYIRGEV